MAKRPGSLVLTFSKKNTDIRKLLESKKAEDENFIATHYICDAIRFYEKNKSSTEFNDLETIRRLIDDRLKLFINANSSVTFGLEKYENAVEEKKNVNEVKANINNLESDLEDIPIDED